MKNENRSGLIIFLLLTLMIVMIMYGFYQILEAGRAYSRYQTLSEPITEDLRGN